MSTSFCAGFASRRPTGFAHTLRRTLVFASQAPNPLAFRSGGNLQSVERPRSARSRRRAHLRLPPRAAGRPAPPSAPPRPARARLIGCYSEGRRRGGRRGLISDADSLLCSVVPDPAAAGPLRVAGRVSDSGSAGGSSGRIAWEAMGACSSSGCLASGGSERLARLL